MKRLFLSVAAGVFSASAALAGPFDGVFVSDAQACGWLEAEGVEALYNHDFFVLTQADGIVANEFGCTFLGREPTPDGAAMVVRAFCEYPGEPYPDLISLRTYDEHSIMVTSLHQTAEDAARGVEAGWGMKIYTQCKNLKELPR